MAVASKKINITISATDKFSGVFDRLNKEAKSTSQRLSSLGKSLTMSVTLPLIAIGVAGVKMASDLDSAMRNVQSVGKQTDTQLKELEKTFRALATSGEFGAHSAEDIAQAFFDIQGAGFAGADAMSVLTASMTAATAGQADLTKVMEGTTAVINSYGLEATDAQLVTDLLFRTVDRGVGSVEALTGATSSWANSAAVAGASMETSFAALSTMTKQGASFATAGVRLNAMMLSFIKPSEKMTSVLQELGFDSGAAAIKALGFEGALNAVTEAVGGGEAAMGQLFTQQRALLGAFALTGSGAQMFAGDIAAMADAEGAAAAARDIQMKSFANQMTLFKNKINDALISVGQIIIPVLMQIMDNISPLLDKLNGMSDSTKKVVVQVLAFAATVGPALIIIAKMIQVFKAVKATILGIRAAMMALNMATLMNPWGIAIIAVAGAVFLLVKNWDKVKEALIKVKDVAEKVLNFLKEKIQAAPDWLLLMINPLLLIVKHWDRVSLALKRVVSWIKEAIKWFLDLDLVIKDALSGFFGGLFGGGDKANEAGQNLGNQFVGGVQQSLQISSPSKVMRNIGQQTGQGFAIGLGQSMATGTNQVMTQVGQVIKQGAQSLQSLVSAATGVQSRIVSLGNNRRASSRGRVGDNALVGSGGGGASTSSGRRGGKSIFKTGAAAAKRNQALADKMQGFLQAGDLEGAKKFVTGGEVPVGLRGTFGQMINAAYARIRAGGKASDTVGKPSSATSASSRGPTTSAVGPTAPRTSSAAPPVVVNITTLNVRGEEDEEQVQFIMKRVGAELAKRGISGRSLTQ